MYISKIRGSIVSQGLSLSQLEKSSFTVADLQQNQEGY